VVKPFVKEHFRLLEKHLKERAKLCQPGLPSSDIGVNREFFARDILSRHLPQFCEITSGCVCNSKEAKPSRQIDLILFNPLSMIVDIGVTNCCLIESVYAVIEVKSSVNEDHFKRAIESFIQVQQFERIGRYTDMRGYTTEFEKYNFNTIGTVLFSYQNYKAVTAVDKTIKFAASDWSMRPEMIYSVEKSYLLVRDDYGKWKNEEGKYSGTPSWLESLRHTKLDGYMLLKQDPLLCLCITLSKRIQCNYHLMPTLVNYAPNSDPS
jgi:hypothetical protein